MTTKDSWLYSNDSDRRVRLRVGGTHAGDVAPRSRGSFFASADDRLSVYLVAGDGHEELEKSGRVSRLCVHVFASLANVFGVGAVELGRELAAAANSGKPGKGRARRCLVRRQVATGGRRRARGVRHRPAGGSLWRDHAREPALNRPAQYE